MVEYMGQVPQCSVYSSCTGTHYFVVRVVQYMEQVPQGPVLCIQLYSTHYLVVWVVEYWGRFPRALYTVVQCTVHLTL